MGTSSGSNLPHQMLPPRQQLQTSLSLISSDPHLSRSNSGIVRESPAESASSQETWPTSKSIMGKKTESGKTGPDSHEQLVIRHVSIADKVSLRDIARERVDIVAERMHRLPEEYLEELKNGLKAILEGNGAQPIDEFMFLQKFVQTRSDLTSKILVRAHRVQLEILVVINTGIQAFLHPNINLSQTSLVDIFVYKRCRNIACQNELPADGCPCEICANRKGFCNLCMCVICNKFDFAVNTCRWIGCDVCSHWTHTDCAIRDGEISMGISAKSVSGMGEMLFKCRACNHTSELLGWVKDVFQHCAPNWDRESLMKELDFDSKDAGGDNNLIGQFGVGFYSAFLVADRVIVSTKSPKSDKQYAWEGEANSSSFTIQEETDPQSLIPRGTRITLHLKQDAKNFADPERIQKLVKNYSQFVSFPIYTWQEKGLTKEVEVDDDSTDTKKDDQDDQTEKKKKTKKVVERYWDWELTNETQPIWLRNPKEVTTEEYNEFYRKAFNEYLDPLASSHFTTEGEVEFRSILYVPPVSPMGKDDLVNQKTKNIRLYVKRVFISDDFDGELFPRYLSFVKGVVDSHDLPLNVSREILQESRIVRIMKKRLVRKAFDMILGISLSENREDYEKFWENFGKHLKLGCIEDRENHKRIAPLLRFFSSHSENDMISLDEYVENMKPEQKAIYYIASDSITSAKNAPFLEKILEKELEVLYLVEPIDEVAIQSLKAYKEKDFVDISKEDLDLGDKNEEKEAALKKEFGQTCDWIKKRLGEKVASVQISNRLSSSPCVLVSGKFGWSANMERLMKAQSAGDTTSLEFMKGRRVFEINPDHSIIKSINAAYKSNPDDEDAMRAIDLMYDAALVSSGFTPENPAELGGKIYEMMGIALSGKWSSPKVQTQQQEMAHSDNADTFEAEVVEPVEVDGKK